jgi:hypothetical protein
LQHTSATSEACSDSHGALSLARVDGEFVSLRF